MRRAAAHVALNENEDSDEDSDDDTVDFDFDFPLPPSLTRIPHHGKAEEKCV
jgi:hypothetical protein